TISSLELNEDQATRQLAEAFLDPITVFAGDGQVPRYGLITQRLGRGASSAAGNYKGAVVGFDDLLELAPLPRKLAPGASVELKAKALGNVTKLKLEMADAVGKLTKVDSPDGK